MFRAGLVDLTQMKLRVWRHNAVENLEFIKPPVVLLNRTNEAHAGGGANRHAKPGGFAQLPFGVDVSFLSIEKPSQKFVRFVYAQGQR